MSTIVTRAGKGSRLTWAEADANFTNLNTDKYQDGDALGTPASGTLTNCTGLPVGSITGLGSNVGAFLATPSSANLASAVTDETGSGKLVFDTSPTLVTPTLGVASATSINKMAITAPATGSTLAIADGKTLTVSNTITLTGTDSTSYNLNDLNAITQLTDESTASGTEAEWTSIPSGVKRIVLSFDSVSTSSGVQLEMLIGDSGGYETTDYYSTYAVTLNAANPVVAVNPSNAKFLLTPSGTFNDSWMGNITLTKMQGSNSWVISGTLTDLQTGIVTIAGVKSTSAALDRLKVLITSGAFAAGSISLAYFT